METLIQHLMYCYRACVKAERNKEIWIHQAFGAVQYHLAIFPEDFEAVQEKWNEFKPRFECQIYGFSLEV